MYEFIIQYLRMMNDTPNLELASGVARYGRGSYDSSPCGNKGLCQLIPRPTLRSNR